MALTPYIDEKKKNTASPHRSVYRYRNYAFSQKRTKLKAIPHISMLCKKLDYLLIIWVYRKMSQHIVATYVSCTRWCVQYVEFTEIFFSILKNFSPKDELKLVRTTTTWVNDYCTRAFWTKNHNNTISFG